MEGHWGSAGTCPGKGADGAALQWSEKELFQEGRIVFTIL